LEPLASNETEAGRQRNRRIEVAIYATKAAGTALR
jgi:flagellar motor protein MotB